MTTTGDEARVHPSLHDGSLYLPHDPAILEVQARCQGLLDQFNLTRADEPERREQLLREMFAELGEGSYVEPPLNANFGGHFCHLGRGVYFNSNVTLVDDTEIHIGDHTMIGPNCVIDTAAHPVHPVLRSHGVQYNKPVHIGRNVWLGASVLVMPGVTIGDDTIVGAGSVVTHDLPAGVVAVGVPCRVLRRIDDDDLAHYDHGRPIGQEWLDRAAGWTGPEPGQARNLPTTPGQA